MYYFDDCVLDAARRQLRRGDVVCRVEPQVFDLLEYLIRNRDRVVSRDDLFAALWDGRIVSDSVLSTRLNAARRSIGDNGAEQRLIRTFRRKGLRFVGSVREEAAAARSDAPQIISARLGCTPLTLGTPRIAVLPFANMTADRKYEYFAAGLAEEVILSLTRRNLLPVASRISSFGYSGKALGAKEIARRLRVRYLLDGSLHQLGDRMRIVVRLVDGLVDRQLWAERFDRDVDDGFAIQDEITVNVMAAIAPQIYFAEEARAARKSPERLNAWERVIRALSLINSREKRHVETAHRLLQKALALDPQSAQAHSLLSIVTTLSIHMGWAKRQTLVPRSLAIAQKALSLNADEPWAHAALGYATIWKRAEDAIPPLERAIALNPNLAVGHYFLALASTYAGKTDHVFAHADMAERLAARDLLARGYAGAHDNVRATASFAQGNYGDGIRFARNVIRDIPKSPTGYRTLIMNLALGGEVEEAGAAIRTLKSVAPDMSQSWIAQNAVWARAHVMQKYVEAFRAAGLK